MVGAVKVLLREASFLNEATHGTIQKQDALLEQGTDEFISAVECMRLHIESLRKIGALELEVDKLL